MNKVLVIVSLCLFTFCSSAQKTATDALVTEELSVPADFTGTKSILLIETHIDNDKSPVDLGMNGSTTSEAYMNYYLKKNRKEMQQYLEKNYPYKYEFVSQNDIYTADSKYADKSVYQYALIVDIIKPQQHARFDGKPFEQTTRFTPMFRFYIYDRLNNKTYKALSPGASFLMMEFKSALKKMSGNS